jgi:hypothetical protein
VSVETARTPGYTGTWAIVQAVPWSAASKVDVVHITTSVGAVRARISTTVTGGTVTVTWMGY